jgi:hypothetical protein
MSGISSEATSSIDYFGAARVADGHVQGFFDINRLDGNDVANGDPFVLDRGILITPSASDRMIKVITDNGPIQCHNNVSGLVYAGGDVICNAGGCLDQLTPDLLSLNLGTLTDGTDTATLITDFSPISPQGYLIVSKDVPLVYHLPANVGFLVFTEIYRAANPIGGVMSGYAQITVLIDDMQ